MNRLKTARSLGSVKNSLENLRNISKIFKVFILFIMISALAPLSAFYMFYSHLVGLGISVFILMVSFILLFIFLFTPETTKTRSWRDSLDRRAFQFKVKRYIKKSRRELNSYISIFIIVSFFIVGFAQFFVLNLILDSVISFGISMSLLIIFMPNSKPARKSLNTEAKLPTISAKNKERKLKHKFRVFKKRLNIKRDKKLKLKCVLVGLTCIISAMALGWTHFYLTDENMPNPLFGKVDQSIRRDGIEFSFEDLEYNQNL
ncbi:hypothetical protein LCGC14_1209260, partial [marine sediment metagenome]